MAPRPRRSKPPVAEQSPRSSAFLDALRFVSVASHKVGAPYQTFTMLTNHWAIAFDGVIAAGHPIEEDIQAAPHNLKLIDALQRCGNTLAVTQLDANRLSIRSDKFRALVPCVDPTILAPIVPDPPCALIDDRLRQAIITVGVLVSETAQDVVQASALLQSGSVLATDKQVMFQAWHGIDLPPGLTLPKQLIMALSKNAGKLTQFGYSQTSATFYFENNAWIRTQLFSVPWPSDIEAVLNVKSNAWPMPPDFFVALDAVAPFSDDGNVYLHQNVLRSHATDLVGAAHDVEGLPAGPVFNAKKIGMIRGLAKKIDFIGTRHIAQFFGDNIRGAVVARVPYAEPIRREHKIDYDKALNEMDDEIPF